MDLAFLQQGDAANGLYYHLGWKGLPWVTVIGGTDLLLQACFENLSHSNRYDSPSPVPLLTVIARKPGRIGHAASPATYLDCRNSRRRRHS